MTKGMTMKKQQQLTLVLSITLVVSLLLCRSVESFAVPLIDTSRTKESLFSRTTLFLDTISDIESISSTPSSDVVSNNDEIPSTMTQINGIDTVEDVTTSGNANKEFLLALGAITGRGEYATRQQKQSAQKVVEKLESSTIITIDSNALYGTWDLVYSSTELFRSSPFFMAGRAVCTTDQQAQQYNWFCTMHRKALAISTIVNVRQIINKQQLISEFEVKVGSIPFLSDLTPFTYSGGIPLTIDGSIVSTADIESLYIVSTNKTSTISLKLFMDTVEIKGSNIPGLRQLYDYGIFNKLQSRTLSEYIASNIPNLYTSATKPTFRITYIDSSIRISRDEDDNIFVYIKTSNNTQPTLYDTIDSDLGIGRLLEGFNDAITRIYQ